MPCAAACRARSMAVGPSVPAGAPAAVPAAYADPPASAAACCCRWADCARCRASHRSRPMADRDCAETAAQPPAGRCPRQPLSSSGASGRASRHPPAPALRADVSAKNRHSALRATRRYSRSGTHFAPPPGRAASSLGRASARGLCRAELPCAGGSAPPCPPAAAPLRTRSPPAGPAPPSGQAGTSSSAEPSASAELESSAAAKPSMSGAKCSAGRSTAHAAELVSDDGTDSSSDLHSSTAG